MSKYGNINVTSNVYKYSNGKTTIKIHNTNNNNTLQRHKWLRHSTVTNSHQSYTYDARYVCERFKAVNCLNL